MIAVLIGLPQLTFALLERLFPSQPFALPSLLLLALFYTYTIVRVLSYVLRTGDVTRDRLYGAVSVYLLLGVAWASVYAFVEALQPGSFAAANPTPRIDFIYFSFVTLTTLGYGDITPVTDRAHSLALLEAVTGVLYIAVLIARLVSLYRPDSR